MDSNSIDNRCQKKFVQRINKVLVTTNSGFNDNNAGYFEMFISEFNIRKYVYNKCTFQNKIMNSFDNCNMTQILIK